MELLSNSLKDLSIGLQTLDAKVEQQLHKSSSILPDPPVSEFDNSNLPLTGANTHHDSGNQLRTMRLDVTRFSGENELAWISRIQRYFEFYNTPDPQHLLIASFHLDGAALDWYDWMSKISCLIIGVHF